MQVEINLAGPRRMEVGWEDSRVQEVCDSGSPTVHRLFGAGPDSDPTAEMSYLQPASLASFSNPTPHKPRSLILSS